MKNEHSEAIEFLDDGISSQPSAVEVARRKGDGDKIDAIHEFYRRRELETSADDLLEILQDENGIERSLALSVLATVMEHRSKIPGYGAGNGDISKARKPMEKLHDMQDRAFRHYEKYVFENNGERNMAWRCLMLLLDFKFLAGGETLQQIVEVCGGNVKEKSQYKAMKATVNKCLQSFQKAVPELPRIAGQRNNESRARMKSAQEKIWRA